MVSREIEKYKQYFHLLSLDFDPGNGFRASLVQMFPVSKLQLRRWKYRIYRF